MQAMLPEDFPFLSLILQATFLQQQRNMLWREALYKLQYEYARFLTSKSIHTISSYKKYR